MWVLVDEVGRLLPGAGTGNQTKIGLHYTGDNDASFNGKSTGPLLLHVVKHFNKLDFSGFNCLSRVLSGSVRVGQTVRVMGEDYQPGVAEEDTIVCKSSNMWIHQARYKVQVNSASPG